MDKPRIAIIDYSMCNLFSVEHACIHVGADPIITSNSAEIEDADGVILPGVGAFKDAMENIRSLGLDVSIEKAIANGKPFLGICLGFQLLFSASEEFGHTDGLGIFCGKVKRFPSLFEDKKLKVPQIGWNKIKIMKKVPVLDGISDGAYMYFIHSYYVEPDNDKILATCTDYGGQIYCSSVSEDNLFACQFHPEKSSVEGVAIYRNWIRCI